MNHVQKPTLIAVAAVTLFTAACTRKKVASIPPPPPPPPEAATPVAVSRPAASPVRTEPTQGPAANAPAPRYPNAITRARIDQLLAKIEDAYFDYDKASLRPDALKTLQADSTELRDILKDYPDYKIIIEGHCDERGSAEYNLALGDRRATAAKDYLVQVGIPSAQLNSVSFGKNARSARSSTKPAGSGIAASTSSRRRRLVSPSLLCAPPTTHGQNVFHKNNWDGSEHKQSGVPVSASVLRVTHGEGNIIPASDSSTVCIDFLLLDDFSRCTMGVKMYNAIN
jgi:peptidoglycan-associated lipoprotein